MRFKEFLILEGKVAEKFDELSTEKGTASYVQYILVNAKEADANDIKSNLVSITKGPDLGAHKIVHQGDHVARIIKFGSYDTENSAKELFVIKPDVFSLFREAQGAKTDVEGYKAFEMQGEPVDAVDDGQYFYFKPKDSDVVTKMRAQLFQKRFKVETK